MKWFYGPDVFELMNGGARGKDTRFSIRSFKDYVLAPRSFLSLS